MKIAIISLFILLLSQTTTAETPESITLRWDWESSASGLTAGPNRDVAFDLYLRAEYDTDYFDDYPLISGIDNCWWNIDQYTCEVTIDHGFESGVSHYFVVVAYEVEAPTQRSSPSNEAEYCPDCSYQSSGASGSPGGNSGAGSGGGGCFITLSKN